MHARQLYSLIHHSDGTVLVGEDAARSNQGRFVLSYNFLFCNGLVLFSLKRKRGLLAHLSEIQPTNFIKGGEGACEKPQDVFPDFTEVQALNIYHTARSAFTPDEVESALTGAGITHFTNVPLRTSTNRLTWRDICLDIEKGEVYIFPHSMPSLIRVPIV
jgi:hypothetical protein